jgi:hypothetical protein
MPVTPSMSTNAEPCQHAPYCIDVEADVQLMRLRAPAAGHDLRHHAEVDVMLAAVDVGLTRTCRCVEATADRLQSELQDEERRTAARRPSLCDAWRDAISLSFGPNLGRKTRKSGKFTVGAVYRSQHVWGGSRGVPWCSENY